MKNLLLLIVATMLSANVFGGDRKLKYRVDVDNIESRSFPVPGGEIFDFGYVLNQMLMVNLGNDPNFLATYALNNPGIFESNSPEGMISVVPDTDMNGQVVPDCLVKRNQFQIAGAVVAFEMTGGNSISFGYNQGGAISDGFGLGYEQKIQKAKLSVAFHAVRTEDFVRSFPYASSVGDHSVSDRQQRISVNFKGFSVSPARYYKSDLVGVTNKATNEALSNISKILEDKRSRGEFDWKTTVMKVGDPEMMIRAGSLDGVKIGDEFMITNMNHEWDGEVCNSEYWGTPVREAMIVKVTKVSELTAIVMPERAPDSGRVFDVYVGDKVTIHKLK